MVCVTSNFGGVCPPSGYYTYPPVGVATNINVGNNVFGGLIGQTQTLTVITPGNWNVVANAATGNTAITGYPSLGMWFPQTPLETYSSIVSSFAENGNYNPNTISDTGYDLWFTTNITADLGGPTPKLPASGVPVISHLGYPIDAVISGSVSSVNINGSQVGTSAGTYLMNGGDTIVLTYSGTPPTWVWTTILDVFIQHDLTAFTSLRGPVPVLAIVEFNGITWNLGRAGREIIFQIQSANDAVTSGTFDILSMLNCLVPLGRLDPNNLTLGLCGYGFEIASTGGLSETFQVSNFTWNQVFAETSPGLELYGFPINGPVASSIVNSVTVSVTENQSSSSANPCWFELWDYSGTPTQIGTAQYLPASTNVKNVSTATFTGVIYNMLNTLRVRVYGRSAPGSGHMESVYAVSLVVNYMPVFATLSSGGSMKAMPPHTAFLSGTGTIQAV